MSTLKLKIWPKGGPGIKNKHQLVFLPDGTEIPNVAGYALSGGSHGEPVTVTLQLRDCEAEMVNVPPRSTPAPGMKVIPVLLDFDATRPIGSLSIDESKLPPGDGYVFALGFSPKKTSMVDGEPVFEEIDLLQVSVQTDLQYAAYLKSQGKA